MSTTELAQLELLAQIDDVVARLAEWTERPSPWEPLQQARSLLRRLMRRVDPLLLRLEAPLVVATFGGTGVGKSSLVNALVGEDVTAVGRQRPTTLQPTLLAHPETRLEAYGLPLDELQVVRKEAPLLRDVLLIDCPDPDTSETAAAGTNLDRLHRILPFCDVLLYVSTQQKYRSARVGDELAQASEACKLVFVQTHADRDDDIRADWRQQLEPDFRVAEMFFVDSRTALAEQLSGVRPSGEFGRLLDLLLHELSAAQRVRIRRGNLFGLLEAALERIGGDLERHASAVKDLAAAADDQRLRLRRQLAQRLQEELLVSRGLWERRLLGQVTQLWGLSPFALLLRLYHGQASVIASLTLLRAHSSAQLALWGAFQGARWLSSRQQESGGAERLQRVAALQVGTAELRESRLVMEGFVRSARLDRAVAAQLLDRAPEAAAEAEDEFWTAARQRLDELILRAAQRNSGWGTRLGYETGFAILPAYLLWRIGKNFFYDSWWRDAPLLEASFYIPAALFLALWSGLFLVLYSRRLRRGVRQQVQQLAQELAEAKLGGGQFPEVERLCRDYQADTEHLRDLTAAIAGLRQQVSETTGLSAAWSRGAAARPRLTGVRTESV